MINGNSNGPNDLGLPNVVVALDNWYQNMTFQTVVKSILNGVLVETLTEIIFKGVMQPLSPENLKIKPQEQRFFIWQQLHCDISLNLLVDDIAQYAGNSYRVMAKYDYNKYGYYEYHLVDEGPVV